MARFSRLADYNRQQKLKTDIREIDLKEEFGYPDRYTQKTIFM